MYNSLCVDGDRQLHDSPFSMVNNRFLIQIKVKKKQIDKTAMICLCNMSSPVLMLLLWMYCF